MRTAAPLASTLALALAGCLATAANPDATCLMTACPAGGAGSFALCAVPNGCAYRTSDGSNFACASCNDCAAAAARTMQWCSGASTGDPSTAAGGGSGGGGGGTSVPTGGGPVVDACTTCAGAAAQSTCATPVAACDGDPACHALGDCLHGCAAADTACIDDCYNGFPLRAGTELDDVGNCLCGACSGSCTSQCG
jgi:hypothetical protein